MSQVSRNTALPPFKYYYTAAAGDDKVIKAKPGYVEGILVGDAVGSSIIEISDHVTTGDGNVKFYLAGDSIGPRYYPIKTAFTVGITLDITNQTHITVIYK